MEVSINNNINHHQLRFFSNLITMQQLDSKLIAFCTILTVALSIMLSFKQSRFLLLNATITTYSFYNVKKCIKCLRSFKVKSNNKNNNESNNNNITTNNNSNLTKSNNDVRLLTYEYLCGYTKYLKLKRLRNIAHKLTTNTIKFNNNSYNYLYRTFNATLLKMKKTTVYFRKSSNNSSTSTTTTKSSSFFRVKLNRNNKNNENLISQQVTYAETYCPTCTVTNNNNNSKNNNNSHININSYCSAPVLTGDLTEQDLNNSNGLLKTKSESNFNRSRNQSDPRYPKYYNSRVIYFSYSLSFPFTSLK